MLGMYMSTWCTVQAILRFSKFYVNIANYTADADKHAWALTSTVNMCCLWRARIHTYTRDVYVCFLFQYREVGACMGAFNPSAWAVNAVLQQQQQ